MMIEVRSSRYREYASYKTTEYTIYVTIMLSVFCHWKFSFKIVVVKISIQSKENSTIVFLIVQTKVKDSCMLLCSSYRSIYVPYFMAKNVRKWLTPLDITAVVGATRLQESFRLVVNLRRHMDLVCSKAGIFTTASTVPEKNVSSETLTL